MLLFQISSYQFHIITSPYSTKCVDPPMYIIYWQCFNSLKPMCSDSLKVFRQYLAKLTLISSNDSIPTHHIPKPVSPPQSPETFLNSLNVQSLLKITITLILSEQCSKWLHLTHYHFFYALFQDSGLCLISSMIFLVLKQPMRPIWELQTLLQRGQGECAVCEVRLILSCVLPMHGKLPIAPSLL